MAKTPKKLLTYAHTWDVFADGGGLLWTVNADNLLVTGDGALNFVATISGVTVSVFVVNAVNGPKGTYRWAQMK